MKTESCSTAGLSALPSAMICLLVKGRVSLVLSSPAQSLNLGIAWDHTLLLRARRAESSLVRCLASFPPHPRARHAARPSTRSTGLVNQSVVEVCSSLTQARFYHNEVFRAGHGEKTMSLCSLCPLWL